MNILHKTCVKQFARYAETATTITTASKYLAEPLTKRALVRIQGAEVVPFLQGLITNDMNHLHVDGNPSMYTMFLNNAGRVLYDSIVYRTPEADSFIIECDRDVSNELRKHLRLFRVRRKINIDCVNEELTPWIVFNPIQNGDVPKPNDKKPDKVLSTPDPRLKELGVRIILPAGSEGKDIEKMFPSSITIEQSTSSQYNTHRYVHGVGEGIIDHPPGKCFPLEANCDFLHGVSFQKGCYVGQELTARVYHTGVIRKRLMPLKLTNVPEADVTSVQTSDGASVGTIRGVIEKQALALLRVEQVLKAKELVVNGQPCETFKPNWWPKDLPSRPSLRKD
ncbi:putative transferase CAF17 homolog, mitochondrial [Episyrphus balteatus]|uniref:putative transferase CAF17 homolog, mitochondrial n=1 Tax=Episyrphus balteatus TaxID=286459 RepID=UPI002485A411|nr:putative transferase CAF17 homolog, mitochondrial [Episyrphus balteatus]